MKKDQKISVIIPSLDESKGIKKVLVDLSTSLTKNKINYEIIVVDDGSTDGTIEIIKGFSSKDKKIKLIIRDNNPGFGSSLIDGSKTASGDIIIWFMGDSSDDFNTIPSMIKKINEGFDLVIGSKNVSGGSRGDQNKLKAIGSKLFSSLARIMFKLPVYDITNAFRAFRKELIHKLYLENGDFFISPEFAIKSHIAGYKISEVPTTYSERKVGEAKTFLFRMGLQYYVYLFKYWIQNISNRLRITK